jgi:ankyrin repeat protein
MWKKLLAVILVSSPLCAAQVPAGATVFLNRVTPEHQSEHQLSENFYTMLETELRKENMPVRLVDNQADAAYEITCTSPANTSEVTSAFSVPVDITSAMAVRDSKTKKVVWTYTCTGLGGRDAINCLAEHFKDAPKGPGEDVTAQYKGWGTALHIAAFLGELDIVEYLIGRGANIAAQNPTGVTPLHTAANGGHLEVVKFLVAHGADVKVRDRGNVTPLHMVGGKGRLAVAEFLVAHGADINARVMDGTTPLHTAANDGKLDVAEFLVAHGAKINALCMAAVLAQPDVVTSLAAAGAKINLADKSGNTPLHYVSRKGDQKMVQLLVEHGADLNARNKKGETALTIAVQNKQTGIADFLRSHGAR